MADQDSPKPSTSRSRAAVVASVVAIVLVAVAVLVALNWGEIQLRYHRHCFRHGTPERQQKALVWFLVHRLRDGMTQDQVEQVLGESLSKRFVRKTPPDLPIFEKAVVVHVRKIGHSAWYVPFDKDGLLCWQSTILGSWEGTLTLDEKR